MTTTNLEPLRLAPHFVERVWGSLDLAPFYAHRTSSPTGEVWLTGKECVVENGPDAGCALGTVLSERPDDVLGAGAGAGDFPLLVKMLFPQQKLSVQVHPNDADAVALGGSARPKTECWYVLRAEPGETVALGLKPGTTMDQVHSTLGTAEFEPLLHQQPVSVGDMIYVDAGTVHAIGGGVVLLEVQQCSDTTYRLYDYGRPRELHLEDGLQVTRLTSRAGKVSPQALATPGGTRLIAVEHFIVDRYELASGRPLSLETTGKPECLILLEGEAKILRGAISTALKAGGAAIIPVGFGSYLVEGEGVVIRCLIP